MKNLLSRYANWLHLRWPAGGVEKLPEVKADGTTAVPGVRVVQALQAIAPEVRRWRQAEGSPTSP